MVSKLKTSMQGYSARKARSLSWLRLISETSSWQATIAALGFASGIAVVRLLDVEQYAIYTIANSLLGALVVLGDSGISSGVMSQGGGSWRNKHKLGVVIRTGLQVCKWPAIAVAFIAIPAALYLFGQHHVPVASSLALATVLIPCFIISVRNNILQIVLKLHQDIRKLQAIQLGTNIIRLLLLAAVLPFAPYALAAILVAGLATLYANMHITRCNKIYVDEKALGEPGVRYEIMRIVWRVLPGGIYYCLQGQLSIWVISMFGTTAAVAQLGALGRLGMIASVVSAMATTLIVPRFARLPNQRPLLLGRLALIVIGMTILCAIGLSVVMLSPEVFLWMLGSAYHGLEFELVLVAAAAAISLGVGLLVSLCLCRGLVPNPFILIPFGVLTQTMFIALNDMSTLQGVLLMNLGASAAMLCFYGTYLFIVVGRVSNGNTNHKQQTSELAI